MLGRFIGVVMLTLITSLLAFERNSGTQNPVDNQPPRSDAPTAPAHQPNQASPNVVNASQEQNDSSSRSTIIDLSPPVGDAQEHPDSDESAPTADGIDEMHPWNPHRAEKDIEVGDFYMKRRNYRAAESRYREALYYKQNDAIATYRLADVLEREGELQQALQHYQEYLKILPHGPYATDARKGIERLQTKLTVSR